jgi:hypothetical protein
MHKGRTGRREIFEHVTRTKADNDLWSAVGFLFKFFFHKFGVEMSLITSVIVIAIRQDVLAFVYLIALIVMRTARHSTIARIWPIYGHCLAVAFIWQYFVCVGMPREWLECYFRKFTKYDHEYGYIVAYPWHNLTPNVKTWLYLPDSDAPPDARLLIGDFFQLLFVWSQMNVFARESDHKGGDNRPVCEIFADRKHRNAPIAIPDECADFISDER